MTAKTLNLKSLTEEQQDAFIEGWKKAGGYTGDLETPNPYPWCCPWDYTDSIEVEGETPEEWGADYWKQCEAEIEATLATEASLAD